MTSRVVRGSESVWMSRAEVARLLQVAPVTIGRWASEGKLPYSVTLGGRRRFRRLEMEAIARRLSEPSTHPAAAKPRRRSDRSA
jgi:excisionase family DNA binding protein